MELLDEESHRILLWAVRLHEVGHAPTRTELTELAEGRRPAGLATVTGLVGHDSEYQEGAIAALLRRGLLHPVGDAGVAPTGLGRRVVDALGLDRFLLVGHDWGAVVAWHVAARPPDRVRTLTAVSVPHPHAYAASVKKDVAQAARSLGNEETIPSTGPSFRDATRVAGANPRMWGDIYHANREALGAQIDDAIARLTRVRAILDAPSELEAWQGAVADERHRLLEAGLVGGATRELRVAVPNKPGVVAELALPLGRAGINISDMALSPSPDNRNGVVSLWCATAQAERAAELIGDLGYPVTT